MVQLKTLNPRSTVVGPLSWYTSWLAIPRIIIHVYLCPVSEASAWAGTHNLQWRKWTSTEEASQMEEHMCCGSLTKGGAFHSVENAVMFGAGSDSTGFTAFHVSYLDFHDNPCCVANQRGKSIAIYCFCAPVHLPNIGGSARWWHAFLVGFFACCIIPPHREDICHVCHCTA